MDMCFDGCGGDIKFIGDLFVYFVFVQFYYDFYLLWGDIVQDVFGLWLSCYWGCLVQESWWCVKSEMGSYGGFFLV